ncbi:2-phospho-L-lactate transferase [Capillimicrobium parvum]|uniref:Phosphoenolpyruvate transferase n=1 Tax=Capillimicrobium parvum TaxID=2884022 RepID=A0A9E7BZK5_9ACTN|nr:2-phospho-L-lactate transferase [Capillimicrobium parvum]UGS35475.1 Phosphoenolpyruvate transferase [Capillimicrobium parvum]
MKTVLLAGGTGGAKLARGLLDIAGDALTVIANTADDIEIYRAHVSPDPDLVTFWLADRIDGRGWGLDGDTFTVMDALREAGEEIWFNLGDRDLALCLRRAQRLADGATLTEVLAEHAAAFGVSARVLPMCDGPVRTHVMAGGEWWRLQEFLVRRRAQGPVDGVALEGAEAARPTAAVLEAIAEADAIVIGPSNPIISIGPILALGGIHDALRTAAAPVVAVSPFVGGRVLKGPTASFLRWAGRDATPAGVAEHYAGVADGFVSDEQIAGAAMAQLVTDVTLGDAAARARVASEVLDFARSLR